MQRVLWVDHSGALGGGQLGLARYLSTPSRTHRHVLLLGGGPLAQRAAEAGAGCTVVPLDYKRPRTWRNARRVRELLRSPEHDLVVTNSLKSAMLAGLVGGRGFRHVTYLQEGLEWFSPPRRAFWRATAGRPATTYLANSAWTASTRWGRAARSQAHVVHTHSGLDHVVDASQRDWRATPLQVLSLSRFVPEKGLDTVLAAARICREAGFGDRIAFRLVGAGVLDDQRYVDRLHRTAQRDGSNVSFHDHVDDVGPHLASSHVLVHATTDSEALGQVLLQAQAAGLVVVSTATGGAAELVEDDVNGVRFARRDAQQLASALMALDDDRARCARLAACGTRTASAYLDAAVTERLEEALASLWLRACGTAR